jgi:hypothetical protein
LTLRANILIEKAKSIPTPISAEITSHEHLLLFLYSNLIVNGNNITVSSSISAASRAASAMTKISGDNTSSFTLKTFWTEQFLGVLVRSTDQLGKHELNTNAPDFGQFIKANLHLTFEDLPLCYYSQEVLKSWGAHIGFVAPDRRRMRGFVSTDKSDKEKECIFV